MEQFKRAKVVMLSTKNTSPINLCALYLHNSKIFNHPKNSISQHLYIISDDEIKEGDLHITSDHEGFGDRKYKIISSTDASLGLPQPSQQFIEKYIEGYNRDNIITDVLVEYESKFETIQKGLPGFPEDDISWWTNKVKINPKDNTITIKKIKNSWNKEEVIEFGNKVREYCKNTYKEDSLHRVFFEWDKWIEENL